MNADWDDGFKSAELDAMASLVRWMLANSFATGHGDTMADYVSGIRASYRKLSQKDLADKYGVSRATIQRIHSGERHQSEDTQ